MKQDNVTHVALHPRTTKHVLFLIGTLLTCGFLAPVWIIWAIATRPKAEPTTDKSD